jgi:hypothetical protein
MSAEGRGEMNAGSASQPTVEGAACTVAQALGSAVE